MPPFFPGHPGCGLLPVGAPPLSRCAGCDMPGAFRAGNPLRQGTCSGVSYAKKNYLCMDTNITTMKVLLINGQPPQGGEHFYRLVRGCPDARSPRHRDGDRPPRDEGHAGLYRLREMCGTGALRLFRCPCIPPCGRSLPRPTALWSARRSIYAGPNGRFARCSTACFIPCGRDLAYKPAAAVAVAAVAGRARRSTRLNKYFTISNMPVVPSQYWNSVHGRVPGEAREDAEGLRRCGCWRGTWRNC